MAIHTKSPGKPFPNAPQKTLRERAHPRDPINAGDCVVTFNFHTSGMEKTVNEVLARLERALAAFKAEWNRKP